MAKLRSFTVDHRSAEAGEWIRPGDEFDDLTLKVRGFSDRYYDDHAQRLRRAARPFGGDVAKVPSAIARSIRNDCLIDHVLLDVRNLEGDDGAPVTVDQLRELLRAPGHNDLSVAVIRAAGMVGRGLAADVEEAAGN